ncbi:MAG TPA: bifunctional homocysteine S-methyltransferase/methylenetetrahydrofolate reductase [Bryobacteraceae bacterium]|jgi:homocysteine S-methyltransferase
MGVLTAPVARVSEFRQLLMDGALEHGALVADGAMGTLLASKGASIQRCLDELNLSRPALVRDVHQEYARAGAQILETNTFGANRRRLALFGFGDKVRAINQAGVRIAREAARSVCEAGSARPFEDPDSAAPAGSIKAPPFVAGTVGPLGVRMEPLGLITIEEARAAFREQIEVLVESGVDLLMLETFQDLKELREAILAAREAAGPEMIVGAHLSVDDDGTLASGACPREFTELLDEWPVDVIGLNCSSGPKVILETIEAMSAWTSKPLSAMPNAGLPTAVGGRNIYSCTPSYMAQYARRFLRAGVRILGGCCGTTPEHIREIREVVRETQPEPRRVSVAEPERVQEGLIQALPIGERSGLGAKLASGRFVAMVEILPPRGADVSREIAGAKECRRAGFDCITVPDGPRASARMSAPALCELIQQKADIECVLHVCCRDRNVLGLQSALLGAHAVGIRNLLCITGDPPNHTGTYPDATAVFDVDSIGLTAMAAHLNQGLDLGGHPLGSQTSLLVGVAANPAASNLDDELRRFELKIKAGAEYAITQAIFDVDLLEKFLRRIEVFKIPVIAGIWPLASFRNGEFMINEMRIPVPSESMARMSMAGSGEAARAEGVAIAREIVERVRGMVAGVQLSAPFGRYQMAIDVVEAIGSSLKLH